jgi:hypothetical protein
MLWSLPGHAQVGFRQGYIVKNNGDTLTGLVFYGMNGRFAEACRFKRFEIIREVTYGPDDLLAFGFRNGRHFESRYDGKRKTFIECTVKASNQTPRVHFLTDYSFTKKQSLWQFGFTGGYQFLKIEIPGRTNTRFFDEAHYNSSFRAATGIFINRKLSKKSDNASIDLSFLYYSDQYYGYAEYKTVSDCRDYISIELSGFQVPLSLKYKFGGFKYRPYVKAGAYGTILIDRSYGRISERQFGPVIFTERYSDYQINNDRGFLVGAGIEIPLGHARKVYLETLYIRGYQLLVYSENYGEPLDSKVNSKGFSVMLSVNL